MDFPQAPHQDLHMEKLAEARARLANILSGRAARESCWHELSRWICPWRGSFDSGARADNADDEEALTLFTGIASRAILKGASGLTSGMTPRNSPWFKPDFTDPELCEAQGAREWLDRLDLLMKDCLSQGGFYQAVQNFNIDLLWAGCALLYSERGATAPLRFECAQIGSFAVALDQEGRLEAVARQMRMGVRALARSFGEDRLSRPARSLLARDPFARIPVWHYCARENSGRWPVSSCWFEDGGDGFLRESGFYEMPYYFTVWNEGSSVYGVGPGDEALPDARQLDILERRKLAGMGKLVDPPVSCPGQLKDVLDLSPGGINFMPAHEEIRPILDLSPYAQSLRHLQEEISVVSGRLMDSLMASIFASIPLSQRPRDMSATEFLERKREALQQLGPVISAYEPNVLVPILNRTLMSLERAMLTPPPPDRLAGMALAMKVDFVSPMANAMRQSGAEAARALLNDAAMIFEASHNAEIFDKLDLDQAIDELARSTGAPGGMVRSDEDVAEIRRKRAEAQARTEQANEALQALQMGKLAAELEKSAGQGQEVQMADQADAADLAAAQGQLAGQG